MSARRVFQCCHPHAGTDDSLYVYERDDQTVIIDVTGTDVWLDPLHARRLGELLIAWATQAEAAP